MRNETLQNIPIAAYKHCLSGAFKTKQTVDAFPNYKILSKTALVHIEQIQRTKYLLSQFNSYSTAENWLSNFPNLENRNEWIQKTIAAYLLSETELTMLYESRRFQEYFPQFNNVLNQQLEFFNSSTFSIEIESIIKGSATEEFQQLKRIKSPYSIFSKLFPKILSEEINLSNIIFLLPIDTFGWKVIFDDNVSTNEFIERLILNLKQAGFQNLTLINLWKDEKVKRETLIGNFKTEQYSFPFQIQIRNNSSHLYEHLCYANYKLLGIWTPTPDISCFHFTDSNISHELFNYYRHELKSIA